MPGFLESCAPPVIFDEVQYAPDLLPYIKERIDANRGVSGQYVLMGSQNLLLAESVTESRAGRAAILRLFPLSRREAEGRAATRDGEHDQNVATGPWRGCCPGVRRTFRRCGFAAGPRRHGAAVRCTLGNPWSFWRFGEPSGRSADRRCGAAGSLPGP